jgi:hypothetical protein
MRSRNWPEAYNFHKPDRTGWSVRSEVVTEPQARILGALDNGGRHTIVIERTVTGSFHLYDGPSRRIIEAGNRPAAIDALMASVGEDNSGAGPVRLHLRGFGPREGQGFAKSAELQLAALGENKRTITVSIEDHPFSPDELKAILADSYKFDEIKVTKVSEPFVTERGETAVDVEAQVRPLRGFQKLLLRFRVILREGIQVTGELGNFWPLSAY